MGSGEARYWVKGLVPCRFLGQRPKPSESLLELISAIFKVHLSLFLLALFFHNLFDTTSSLQDSYRFLIRIANLFRNYLISLFKIYTLVVYPDFWRRISHICNYSSLYPFSLNRELESRFSLHYLHNRKRPLQSFTIKTV